MSTKSIIALKDKDQKVTYAHCHYDGYPEYMKKRLKSLDSKEIKHLVSNGLIIEIEQTKPKTPTFYSLDRKDYPSMTRYISKEKFLKTHTVTEENFYKNCLPSEYEECWTYLYDASSNTWEYWEHGQLTNEDMQELEKGVF